MARRDYQNNYGSVTTVLGILRKIGLEFWFKNNSAQFCNEESSKGKEIGTQIHEAIQNHIEKEEVKIETQYGEEVSNALQAFMQFKKDNPKIKLKKAEMPLTSEKHQYNGTLDCIGKIGKDLVLLDWKTGKCKKKETKPKIYPEHEYQLAAYFFAYNETHEAQLTSAYVLVLAKDKVAYNFKEFTFHELSERFVEVFLPCLQIYNYQRKK